MNGVWRMSNSAFYWAVRAERPFSIGKKKKGHLSKDTLDRLSYLLGIYKALHILFSARSALQWLRNPNKDPLFNGQSPLDYMLSGYLVALADVRRYLDWARG